MNYNAFLSYSHAKDSDLAPKLEEGLEKFAKPIFKKRALDIFRDANDLSASPDLWGKIEDGLDNSEYFIFLGSIKAAQSRWCRKEVEHWKINKSMANFLVVLTDGDLLWDETKGDFDWAKTTALPDNLSGAFINEPLYVDFRHGFTNDQLHLENPEFKKNVVLLAATIHKKSVGDLVGEATKQHKRLILVRNSVIGGLTTLLLIAIISLFFAVNQKRLAVEQTLAAQKSDSIAQVQRKIAMDSSDAAKKQRNIARQQRDIAEEQTKLAIREQERANDSAKVAKLQRDIAKASLLTFRAQIEENATKSFLLVKEALKYDKNKVNVAMAHGIYNSHNLSRSILINGDLLPQKFITFLPNDNSKFITYGELMDHNGIFDQKWENMSVYFTKNGKKTLSEGIKYRLWSIEGELIDELSEEKVLDLLQLQEINLDANIESSDYIASYYMGVTPKIEINNSYGELLFELYTNINQAQLNDIWIAKGNKYLVTIWSDGVVRLWDFKTKFLSEYDLNIEEEYFSSEVKLTFSSDNSIMLVSINGEFLIWDLKSRGVQNSTTIEGTMQCVKFLSNSSVAIKTNTQSYIWNISDDTVIISNTEWVCDSSNPDQDYYICGDYAGMICKKTDNEFGEEMVLGTKNNQELMSFALFPSKKFIITSGFEIFKNPSFNKKLFKFYDPINRINSGLSSEIGSVINFNIPQSENYILAWQQDYMSDEVAFKFELSDVNEGEVILKFPTYYPSTDDDYYTTMNFSPNEQKILIAYGNMLTIWNKPKTLNTFLKSGFTNELLEVEKARVIRYVRY